MLLTKEVEVGWNPTNREHYEKLGYEYKWHGKFIVPIEHLTENSHAVVDVLCDYCLEEGVENHLIMKWQTYSRSHSGVIHKDCCKNHWNKKLSDTTKIKYGVDNVSYLDNVVNKIKLNLRMDYNEINNRFIDSGYKLLLTKEQYDNDLSISSKTKLPYICPYHPNENTYISIDDLKGNVKCKHCALESMAGENHPNWNGGISSLNQFLRSCIVDWKSRSMKNCNYKCVLTGDKFNDIHHLTSFNLIVQNILNETGIEIKQEINDYTLDELELLKTRCVELHNTTELGVCLTTEMHRLFHSIYGRKNNTPEQFEEFKKAFSNPDGGWCEYDVIKRGRAKRKKEKQLKNN